MNSTFKSIATGALAPKLARRFHFSWLLYGAAAYFGLKYLNKSGILTKQTGAALDFIDQGLETVKETVGFKKDTNEPKEVTSLAKTPTPKSFAESHEPVVTH